MHLSALNVFSLFKVQHAQLGWELVCDTLCAFQIGFCKKYGLRFLESPSQPGVYQDYGDMVAWFICKELEVLREMAPDS